MQTNPEPTQTIIAGDRPTLHRILSHLLSSELKQDDAPDIAQWHLLNAIALLYSLIPEYNSDDPQATAYLDFANEYATTKNQINRLSESLLPGNAV